MSNPQHLFMAGQDAGGALSSKCKWTARENGRQLAAELLRKAALLPFTKDYAVVPVLFLKNEPTDNSANVMLPQDVIGLLK